MNEAKQPIEEYEKTLEQMIYEAVDMNDLFVTKKYSIRAELETGYDLSKYRIKIRELEEAVEEEDLKNE